MADMVTYEQVAALAVQLPAEDQQRLAQELMAALGKPSGKKRSLMEFRGMVPHPYLGEDAQAWVSRSRREDDDHRQKQWRST